MTTALLVAAFLMGFLGSPHCLGMCGGLVAAFSLSMKDVSPAKRRRLIATYHFGRLVSYSILGLVAGLIGTTVLEPLMKGNSTPRILLGLVLVFGLGTVPMLVATHETVGWLRDKIGRFRLRQVNGALMVLSGMAVIFVPMIMMSMHSGHGGHGGEDGHAQMDHGSPSAMMSEADNTSHQDMSQMNDNTHDMNEHAETVDHTQ